MLAETISASVLGVDGTPVRVEVDVAFGLPALTIVGLAGSQVQEARERVRSAIRNSGFEIPARRITVNLSPADLPKDGTGYDLAIAVGILAASGQLRSTERLARTALVGELALDGALRPVVGVMALAAAVRDAGLAELLVAATAGAEAAVVGGLVVRGAATLGDAVAHLTGVRDLSVASPEAAVPSAAPFDGPDLSDVRGQAFARRALEIAIAGRHNLALVGPPGIGKTLLLRCTPGLLPPLGDDEAIEVSRIYSVAGLLDRRAPLRRVRPFRAPHHTISTAALIGGGPHVRPGEASLAHHGALMLDETLQFRSDALEALRQPLEAGTVTIARVEGALTFPASFALLAAFNPCPCGWRGARGRECSCDDALARRHAARMSGPLRDRIDLWVAMAEPATGTSARPEASRPVLERVERAWERQVRRQGGANGQLSPRQLQHATALTDRAVAHLLSRGRRFRLSPRRLHRVTRIARTIADLAGSEQITVADLDEAIAYRPEAIS